MSQKTKSYGNQYLYSEDLLVNQKYQTAQVEISEAIPPNTLKSADGRLIDKWTLRFAGKDKMLVIGPTNRDLTHSVTGNPPGPKWVGCKITLQVRIVDAFNDKVTAIRVMPPAGCMIRRSLLKRLGEKAVWQPPSGASQ